MTIWLQKRLAVWIGVSLCGGALLWNVGALRAQSYADIYISEAPGKPPQKLARAEAAKRFGFLMNASSEPSTSSFTFDRTPDCISRRSERDLGRYSLLTMFRVMSNQWKERNQVVKVQNESDKTATVILEDAPITIIRPLVLVEEDGGWGVDLVETYAKWNNLQGVAKAEAIYKLTGAVLQGLPRSENILRSSCQSNMKQVALGIAQYVQDYDEAFPPAKKWIDVLQPYVRSEAIFNCPALPKGQRYGYAYNSKLAGKYLNHLPDISRTTSIYETSILKRNAYGVGENRAFRHQNGANYAFADGHVKWFPKTAMPSFKLKP